MKKILPFILVIVFIVAMAVPTLAVSYNGAEFPAPYGANTSYFAYQDYNGGNTGVTLLAMDVLPNEYYAKAIYQSTGNGINIYDLKIVFNESSRVTYYFMPDSGNSWSYVNETTTNGFNMPGAFVEAFVFSTVDVTSEDGHVVFQAPLTLEGAIQNSLATEATTLGRTMITIALCGVGCLAFLILLPTLKKIFYHFRIK